MQVTNASDTTSGQKYMAEVTVSQFAEVLKVPVDRLLAQLEQAGIKVSGADDRISDDAKLELLTHLRRSHGSGEGAHAAPSRITLSRKTQQEIKLAGGQGRARTVTVEVRTKRTYINRDVLQEKARQQQDELEQKRREAEEEQQGFIHGVDLELCSFNMDHGRRARKRAVRWRTGVDCVQRRSWSPGAPRRDEIPAALHPPLGR
jgi:hypothetical protein